MSEKPVEEVLQDFRNAAEQNALDADIAETAEQRIRRYDDGHFFPEIDLDAVGDEMLMGIFESRKIELVDATKLAVKAFYQTLPRELMIHEGPNGWFPESVFTDYKERWDMIRASLGMPNLENYHQAVKKELFDRLSKGRRCIEAVIKARAVREAKAKATAEESATVEGNRHDK
jgi:hypothetical protein